jgi:type I restriction enzyme S subunit
MLKRGDIVMTAAGATIGKTLLYDSDAPACFAGYLARFRPRKDLDSRFVAYWMESQPFWDQIHIGRVVSTIENFSAGKYQNLRIRCPDVPTQRAIADYLDRETARIDALIEKKHRLLDLLHERLEAAISDLVKGTWPAVALRRAWRVIDCKHVTPSYVDTGIPVVSPGDTSTGRLRLESCARFVTKEDFALLAEGDRRPRRGDIVYGRNATVGVATYVDFDEPFCLGQDVCLIRSSENDQRFLAAFLNTVGARQLAEQVVGSTFNRINIADILSLRIPLPPRKVQGRIADEIDGRSGDYWKIRRHLENQLSLMSEWRQAAITAAVTGQFPIVGAA